MTDITNDNAVAIPSNHEVCQRSGFRVKIGELVKEWDGGYVRKESYDARHPQDFVRSKTDVGKKSVSPEPAISYIADDEQIEASDL